MGREPPSAALIVTMSAAVGQAPEATTIYLHPGKGADTNPGTRESPLRTLAAAARRVSEGAGEGPTTIIVTIQGLKILGMPVAEHPKPRIVLDHGDLYQGPNASETCSSQKLWSMGPGPRGSGTSTYTMRMSTAI